MNFSLFSLLIIHVGRFFRYFFIERFLCNDVDSLHQLMQIVVCAFKKGFGRGIHCLTYPSGGGVFPCPCGDRCM